MDKFGLLGEKLGHSYSPQIHAMLCPYEYGLYEVERERLAAFLAETELQGMNVTIPYKKAVMPMCSALSEKASRIGSVNTLVRRGDGWYGDNTDYDGFAYMLHRSGAVIAGKKAVILGSGGASLAVRTVLSDLGASEIAVISRSGADNYQNLFRHADAQIVVNATPVGMYPNNGSAAADLTEFPQCEAVFDLVYNPMQTTLLLQAEQRGLIWANGLGMLTAQAKRSAELFIGGTIDDARVEEITAELERSRRNIILIGMPGCGKSTVGSCLAAKLGRPFFDTDEEIAAAEGKPIPEIFKDAGEAGFRAAETRVLERLGKASGCVIATGGGCIIREENYALLHQNGRIVWLRRALDLLPTDGRPLSQAQGIRALYEERKGRYAAFADLSVDNDGTPENAAARIKEAL